MANKIWVLFSVANEYDQPDNNLIAWWYHKPTTSQLAEMLKVTFDAAELALIAILGGETVRIGRYFDYSLREITEGIEIPEKE